MPVEQTPVHPLTVAPPHYGCHNRPRPSRSEPVHHGQGKSGVSWPYVFSTKCAFDLSLTDSRCCGCVHADGGLAHAEEMALIRAVKIKDKG